MGIKKPDSCGSRARDGQLAVWIRLAQLAQQPSSSRPAPNGAFDDRHKDGRVDAVLHRKIHCAT
jgi:hypothetical protein